MEIKNAPNLEFRAFEYYLSFDLWRLRSSHSIVMQVPEFRNQARIKFIPLV